MSAINTTPTTLPAGFDPMLQNFTLYMPDGTAVLANIPSIDTFIRRNGQVCVVYGAQLGASVLMLFVILITTRETKRRSPIFILNVLSLLLSFLRSLLQILYWLGPWNEIYRYLAYDYSTVPRSAYDNSAAAVVLTLLLLITIEASFVLQTNIVCLNTPPLLRWGVVVFSIIITLLTVSVRFVFCVRNIQGILKASYLPDTMMLGQASLITETVSIWFFCLIFVTKLAWALYQRRKMGLKQWGPMQIICIMGGCTMIIPSIFAILDYFPDATFREAGTLAICLVAIMLPLSSIWAAAAIDCENPVQFRSGANFGSGSSHSGASHSGASWRRGSDARLFGPKSNTTVQHMSRTSEEGPGHGNGNGSSSNRRSSEGVLIERSYEVQSAFEKGQRNRRDSF